MGTEDGQSNPLRDAFEQALRALDAAPLTGSDESVTVGLGEFELAIAWADVQRRLGGDSRTWADDITELLAARLAEGRAAAGGWNETAGRVLPIILSKAGGGELARRHPDVLVYPYAGVLLIVIAVPFEGGWRYVLRDALDEWRTPGEEVIERAVGNLRAVTGPAMIQAISEDHYVLDCGDGLDSSRMLILDELLPEVTECGALTAVPAREVISFAPFTGAGIQHLKAILNLAERGYARWPNPLTPSLFYIAPQTALHVPFSHDDDGTPRLRMPHVLADIQAGLVVAGKW